MTNISESGPFVRSGPRLETSNGPDDAGHLSSSEGQPDFPGVFFPLLLHYRIALGVAGVRGDLAPAMPLQEAIHHGRRHGTSEKLCQRRSDR